MSDLPSLDFVKPVGHDGHHHPMRNPAVHPDPYPEHTKLGQVRDRSQAIGEFLEWLNQEQGYVIAEYEGDELWPVHRSIESWLAQFFQIDPVKLEQEKRAMLDRQRELNAQHDAKGTS